MPTPVGHTVMPGVYVVRRGSPLTRTELAVLSLTAQGWTDTMIAAHRGVTRSAIKGDLDRAFRRLGVHSRIEAFRALGWLRVEDVA